MRRCFSELLEERLMSSCASKAECESGTEHVGFSGRLRRIHDFFGPETEPLFGNWPREMIVDRLLDRACPAFGNNLTVIPKY